MGVCDVDRWTVVAILRAGQQASAKMGGGWPVVLSAIAKRGGVLIFTVRATPTPKDSICGTVG